MPNADAKPALVSGGQLSRKSLDSDLARRAGLKCWFWAGWEPLRHYRRMGKSGSPFFGKGAWLPEWQDRKFSNDLIDAAVRDDATTLITEFFKGFGRRLEQENWATLKDFVNRCHDRGLQVWGYAQARSIYYETLASEVEDWESWAARSIDGKRQVFAKTYYRCAPCLTSAAYAEYLASVISDGAAEIGFDGIHLDNAYYEHCWCPRCAGQFQVSLQERGDLEALIGIPFSTHIQPPPLPPKGGVGLDALQILWLQFGADVRNAFFRALRERLLARLPHLMISGNPAFPRGDSALISRCVDPDREGMAFDYLCCENGNLPRIDAGWIASQAEAHLLAEAGQYKVWVTSWREVNDGVSPPRAPGGIWASAAEEYSFGGMLGNNWAFRPAGEGGRFFFEDQPEMEEAFREACGFFRSLDASLQPGQRSTRADVAILHDARSASLGGDGEIRLNLALQQFLLRRGIPFQIVFPGRKIPQTVRNLLVFHAGAISDQTISEIRSFAEKPGCGVWLAGNSAQNNEWFTPRDGRCLTALRSAPGIHYSPAFGENWQKAYQHPIVAEGDRGGGYFAKRTLQVTQEDEGVFEEFFGGANFVRTMNFERPAHVLVHVQDIAKGRIVMHFRDQSGSAAEIEGVTVHLLRDFPVVTEARFFSPESGPDGLSIMEEGPGRRIFLPAFRNYAAVVLTATE